MPNRHGSDYDAARRMLGNELRRLRKEARLTQESLATKAGYSRVYVTLVETARETPGRDFVERMETALDASGSLTSLYADIRPDEEATTSDASRSSHRIALSASATRNVRTSTEPTHKSVIDAMQSFRAADRLLGGGHLYDTVTEYLRSEMAPRLLDMDATDGKAHFVAAAGLMDMAGWMAHDTGRHALAEHHFDRAHHLVSVGEDDQLRGHIYGGLSHLAHHVGAPRRAIEFARAGQRALGAGQRRHELHARLLCMEARGHAARHDTAECERLLKEAEGSLTQVDEETPSVWVSSFDEGAFASEAATCMQRLGRSRAAELYAHRVIELRPRHRPRSRALGQLTLVAALIAQRRVDEACEVAADVLSTTNSLRSTVVLDRLIGLQAALHAHRSNRVVADFVECLRSTLRERTCHAQDEQ